MSAFAEPARRWAYRGQHATLQYTCALAQLLVRRFWLGERVIVEREQVEAVRRRYLDLVHRDLEQAEVGLYPKSLLFQLPLGQYARTLPLLARDMPRVVRRMVRGDWKDLPTDVDLGAYPPYYRRAFHWQSDGYLSRHSARIYDVGVEFLFGGMADVMRRQVIPPVTRFVGGLDANARLLDVACGTGRTLVQLRHAFPNFELTGLDLSRFYLEEAKSHFPAGDVRFIEANAEAMPLDDGAFDVVTSVFLFHELPKHARRRVLEEMHRVLRPGGQVVIVDSVQHSDGADVAYFLDRFSRDMHEPFFAHYVRDDLATALDDVGFDVSDEGTPAFMSKVVVARKKTTG